MRTWMVAKRRLSEVPFGQRVVSGITSFFLLFFRVAGVYPVAKDLCTSKQCDHSQRKITMIVDMIIDDRVCGQSKTC